MTTWAEVQSRHYGVKVAVIAADLRSLADRIEREGKPRPSSVYTAGTEHQTAAGAIVHAVMWGLANINLDGLIREAADADAAPHVDAEATP